MAADNRHLVVPAVIVDKEPTLSKPVSTHLSIYLQLLGLETNTFKYQFTSVTFENSFWWRKVSL